MYYLDNPGCCYCESPFVLYSVRTREHVIPLSRGGKSGYPNKASCCPTCNTAKSNLLPSEFLLVIENSYREKREYKGIPVSLMPNIIKNLKSVFMRRESDPQYLNLEAKNLFNKNVAASN